MKVNCFGWSLTTTIITEFLKCYKKTKRDIIFLFIEGKEDENGDGI